VPSFLCGQGSASRRQGIPPKSGYDYLYVDGSLQATLYALPTANNAQFMAGGVCSSSVPHNGFRGLIDEVQVYDQALYASDVLALYRLYLPVQLNALVSGANILLSWTSQPGVIYQLQASADLSNPSAWSNLGSSVAGDGTVITVSDTLTAPPHFYRLTKMSP
jgi:hypothetical protein